ncbi:MAG: MaoC family dehydratase N-terminal domain-containing protein [Clostridiales bacterium]|nr:MaoC family dehydratase N-terminal domain-containing protein [Clostridiales bacterium]MDY3747624.1 hypothetical protein [Lachnospiraceae bacterium]
MKNYQEEDFIVRYPGIYDEKEQEALDKFWKEANAINQRGAIDVEALVTGKLPEDTPGLGPFIQVTEAMIKYNHEKYEQENPVYNDKEYAKKAGYLDIPAYRTFGCHDDTFTTAFPPEARDTLCVSQASHWIENFQDVYAGDSLYLVTDKRVMEDITPAEGSVYRSVVNYNDGSVYNQKGELVNKVHFHYVESVRTFKPERRPENFGSKGFADIWEAPDWMGKEDHYYTDEDYEYFKEIWKKEEIRGAEPRYWEDVQIGERPAVNLEGPLIESALPAPFGHGIGGTRTMKKEILDEEIFKTMIRDHHGIYKLQNAKDYTPEIPNGARPQFTIDDGREAEMNEKLDETAKKENDGATTGVDTSDIHGTEGDARAAIINFYGRDLTTHHLLSWAGDDARLESISWSIMPSETHAEWGCPVPKSPYYVYYMKQVPELEGKRITTHGVTRDIAEIHSVVADKYVRNGKYIAKLIWWINDITGAIWIDGAAEISLPHK